MPVLQLLLKVARMCGLSILACYMTIVFLFSGLFLNFLQLVLYLTLYKTNRRLYRKINYYLIYFSWIQILSVYEWRSNSSVKMYGSEESLQKFGKEHCIVVMNHKYDIDWLVCWFVTNHLRMMGNSKTCAKKQLRNVPVIGWGWVFAEMIFLERNWDKDKITLPEKLDNIAEYEDPIILLYFCEGTRFTPEKHKASMEFAKARNLPLLQHHLTPRTSGFNFTAKHLKNKIPAVYNIQLGFPESEKKATFGNLLRGYSFTADLYVDRIPMSEVPTDSDEATSRWQHELYQKKDKLMDDYIKTQKFPGKCVHVKRSYRSLIISIFWSIVVGIPFTHLIISIITTGNMAVVITLFLGLSTIMYYMLRATKADKGSSYGKDKKKQNGAHQSANGECDVTEGTNATLSSEQRNNNL